MNFKNIKTEVLIDCLPQNKPLYKDSGLWQVRTDDMEDVIFQQHSNETFREFIERYCETLTGNETFMIDLSVNI